MANNVTWCIKCKTIQGQMGLSRILPNTYCYLICIGIYTFLLSYGIWLLKSWLSNCCSPDWWKSALCKYFLSFKGKYLVFSNPIFIWRNLEAGKIISNLWFNYMYTCTNPRRNFPDWIWLFGHEKVYELDEFCKAAVLNCRGTKNYFSYRKYLTFITFGIPLSSCPFQRAQKNLYS